MNRYLARILIAVAYVGAVVSANVMSEQLGLVSIGFGLLVSAGTFAAGATLLARNIGQDIIGRPAIVALMGVGIGLSWWLASPALAVASAAAFGCSEVADMTVYSSLRKRGLSRALVAAAIVGGLIDTFVFLHLAHFPVTTNSVTGQMLVKVGISTAVAAVIALAHRGNKHSPIRTVPADLAGVTVFTHGPIWHHCPVFDEIDEGTIIVEWRTTGHTLELHSLAEYMYDWRDIEITHENLCSAIYDDVKASGVRPVRVRYAGHTSGVTVTAERRA